LSFVEVQTGLGATRKKFGCGVALMLDPLKDLGVLDSTWGRNLADMVRAVLEVEIVEQEGLIERAALNGERPAMGNDDTSHGGAVGGIS